MPQTHSNPVAVERRMDLASLFCMIGRHGPAVALAVIAMVSVVAGFIIYRTVRGKRRKATAAAADSLCKSPGEESDASVIQPSSVESTVTDVSDEGLSDAKEDVDLIHSDLKIRHRATAAAAAKKQPPAYSPPKSDIQISDNKHSSHDAKETPFVWDSYKEPETCEQEASQNLQSDTPAVAAMLLEDTVDCHQGANDEITDDVIKEVYGDVSCLKEPEQVNDETCEEKVKVLKAECHNDEDVITDKDVSDEKTRQEDEKCALINPECFKQTPSVSKQSDDDRLQDNKPTVETNSMEPSTSEQQIHLPSTQQQLCDHVIDKVTSYIQGSDWDEDRSQGSEVIEDVINQDHLSKVTAVASDAHLSEFDKQGGDIGQKEENGLLCNPEDGVLYDGADQVKEEMLTSDDIVACSEDCHSPCVALMPVMVDTLDDTVSVILTGEKPQILADVSVPDLPSDCHQLQKDEITPTLDEDDDSAIPSHQMLLHETGNQPENNDKGTSAMMVEEHSDHVCDPQVQSCGEDQQMTKNEDPDTAASNLVVCDGESITTPVMAEKISHPRVSASVATEPDTSDPGAASLIVEEISCAHNPSTCQDQQGDHIEKTETFDETRIDSANDDACTNATFTQLLTCEEKTFPVTLLSLQDMENSETLDEIRVNTATDAPTCDNATITSTIISEETSQPDASPSSQDKQNDHVENNETLDEMNVHIGTDAPAHDNATITSSMVSEETSHSDMLLSSPDQQNDHMENSETLNEIRVNIATDALTCDDATITSTIISEETSQPEVYSSSQDKQNDHVENNETLDEMNVHIGTDASAHDNATITSPIMPEETSHSDMLLSSPDQQNDHMENNETLDEIRVNTATDALTCDDATNTSTIISEETSQSEAYSSSQDKQSDHVENSEMKVDIGTDAPAHDSAAITSPIMSEETSHSDMLAFSQDQQRDHIANDETSDETRLDTTTDALASDSGTITSTIMSEETSQLDIQSCSPYQQSDQTKNRKDTSEVTTIIAAVMTEDISPPMCLINLTTLEPSELNNNGISSPSVGEESGISSMAVSPDLPVAGNDFNLNVESMVPAVMDRDLQYVGQRAAQNSRFNDDVALSVTNENTAGMVFGPYPSQHSQPPQSKNTEWTKYESFAVNEDMFGHEIEDKYHKVMEQFMAQMTTSVASFPDELKEQRDVKVNVEVSEIKKAGVSVKKEATKGEREEEEDYEKTEISIMEATMDNNEWITDSNYQTLPWMNLSATSFAQDHTNTDQLPTEERQYSTAQTEDSCVHSVDTPPSTEDTQNSTLSAVDENVENNKKVVAVQPMAQRVNVTFRVHYFIQSPYQKVAVTGNQQELGNWKGFIPLERAKDGHWAGMVSLPADTHVEWKFVIVDKGEVCRWEECGNRLLDTGYGDDLLVHKWWGYF